MSCQKCLGSTSAENGHQMALEVKNLPANKGDIRDMGLMEWQPIPVFLPGESRGRRNLVGYSP